MAAIGTKTSQNVGLSARKLRFGAFEVDLPNRELRSRGLKIKLQEKPFRILELLLARPGDFVTREELVRHLWPDLNVNFERSLNTALNLLRGALGDTSRNSRFIETRSGLGYRFIAPVELIAESNSIQRVNSKTGDHKNSVTHQDCLKGRHFAEKMDEDSLRKSVAHFQSAIAQDPLCAPGYAGLANAYTRFAYIGMLPPIQAGMMAKDCAAKALQLEAGLPEAHTALAAVKASFDWDWTTAEAAYLRALELDPDDAEACCGYAALLAKMGRNPEATRLIRRAHELDPLSVVIGVEAAWIFCAAGELDAAIEQCWQALTIEPTFAPAQHTLAVAYQRLGQMDEAVTEFENARICSGDNPGMAAELAYAYASCGRGDEALAILQRLEQASKVRYISHYWFSLIWTGLGVHNRALEQLEMACENRDVWLTYLGADPRFNILKTHASFRRTLKLVGLSA
jgi:DNA-binding winged helix-turn-helix (wHTH) protein/Flp pilus assembly protein TadD